jgi:large subunit ribosomal protein L10
MDNPKADKVAVVDEVRSRFEGSDAVIVTEYRGLKVKDLSALRRSLQPLGAEYRIYKNTLVRIAAEAGGEDMARLLTGPTGLTFVKGDAAAVTKALRDFARTNQLLLIKGGLLGRSVLSAQETVALADLPSREVLLARLAGGLAAPLQSFAGLLAALPRNFAYGLKALVDQKVASGEATAPAPAPSPEPTAPSPEPDAASPSEPAVAEAEVEAASPSEPAAEAEGEAASTSEAPAEVQGEAASTNEAPAQAEADEPNAAEPAEGADDAAPDEGAERDENPDAAPAAADADADAEDQ